MLSPVSRSPINDYWRDLMCAGFHITKNGANRLNLCAFVSLVNIDLAPLMTTGLDADEVAFLANASLKIEEIANLSLRRFTWGIKEVASTSLVIVSFLSGAWEIAVSVRNRALRIEVVSVTTLPCILKRILCSHKHRGELRKLCYLTAKCWLLKLISGEHRLGYLKKSIYQENSHRN